MTGKGLGGGGKKGKNEIVIRTKCVGSLRLRRGLKFTVEVTPYTGPQSLCLSPPRKNKQRDCFSSEWKMKCWIIVP